MSLAERVQMFDSIGQNLGRPPRIGGATGAPGRRRRKQNPRFLTQPITVDEVEKARKGFMEPGSILFLWIVKGKLKYVNLTIDFL